MGDIIFILILTLFVTFLSIKYSNLVVKSFLFTVDTFVYILIPSLFMMLIISKILQENKYIKKIIKFISPFFMKVFGFEALDEVFVFLFSFLSGNPTSHILINNLYKKNKISKYEANRLSTSLCFSSFLYLYKSSIIFFKTDIWLIIIVTYIIPILFLIKPQKKTKNESLYFSDYPINLTNIINESFEILIKIFSFVFFFDIIASFLVQFFNINQAYSFFLSNILDMTVATRFYFSFNRIINIFLYCFFNAFLGISIHLQIISVTNYLNYTSFLLKRSIIGLISGIIVVILYYNYFLGFLTIIMILCFKILKKNHLKNVIPKF